MWRPLVFLVLISAVFPSCGKLGKKKTVPSPSDKVHTVSTVKVQSQTVPDVIDLKGVFNASQRVVLKSDFTGRVQALSVIEGQTVATGDAISKIDDDKLTYVLDRQRAELKEAEAQLELNNRLSPGAGSDDDDGDDTAPEVDEDEGPAEAPQFPSLLGNAEPEAVPPEGAPTERAFEQPGASPVPGQPFELPPQAPGTAGQPSVAELTSDGQDILEEAKSPAALRARLRQSRLAARRLAATQQAKPATPAQENADVQESRVGLDQARIDRLKAEIALTEKQLTGSTLSSPIDGFVTKVPVTEGALVKPDDILVEILQVDPIELTVKVPKEQIEKLDKSMEVKVTVPDLNGQSFPGEISFIGAELDQDKKSVEVRVRVANPNLKIKVGMEGVAEIGIANKTHQGLLVPPEALIRDKDKRYVYAVDGAVAEKREVVTGAYYDGQVEIKDGVRAGEVVVTRGLGAFKEDEEFVKVSN